MKILKSLLFVATIALPLTVFADGNKLLAQCQAAEQFIDTNQSRDDIEAAYCLGLLEGVRTTLQSLNDVIERRARVVCWPSQGIGNAQTVRVVLKYLRDNPKRLHEDAVILTMLSFKAAFPCD